MPYIFEQMTDAAKAMSFQSAEESRQWFRDQAAFMTNVKAEDIVEQNDPFKIFKENGTFGLGNMYLFAYDPKTKASLPFYDMYPLVFPIEMRPNGFLGLNLHYLPPTARGNLMNALYTTKNNDKYNESTKLSLSYDVLRQSARRFAGFENCVKSYLFGHVKSRMRYIKPQDWDKALMLPMQRWIVNPDRRYSSKAAPPY